MSLPTRTIFLWFADGGTTPVRPIGCINDRPPPYHCAFATTPDGCKRQIQDYLDRWYADFNVVFTYHRPTEGPFFTVLVTTDSNWCGLGDVTGVGPSGCDLDESAVSLAMACERDARECAGYIAQEQAHGVGLAHSRSLSDVMYVEYQPSADGFENKDNPTTDNACRKIQNSYALMLERLGSWSANHGGTNKPDPAGAPEAPIPVGARDASPDAPPAIPARSPGGCAVTPGRPPASLGILLTGLFFGREISRRRHRIRRARGGE